MTHCCLTFSLILTKDSCVVSKLKCPLFVASEMSGFVNLPQPPRRWESGNPAHFAGFPSALGKSVFGLFQRASFPRPCRTPVSHGESDRRARHSDPGSVVHS